MYENVWLGSNELAIIIRDGCYLVIERELDYKVVFHGKYEECVNYCNKRYDKYLTDWLEYMESIAD